MDMNLTAMRTVTLSARIDALTNKREAALTSGMWILANDHTAAVRRLTALRERHCTDCGATLPLYRLDGQADTFPRCSTHAF